MISQPCDKLVGQPCQHHHAAPTYTSTFVAIMFLLSLQLTPSGCAILLSAPTFSPCPRDGPLGNCTTQLSLQAAINLTAETAPIQATTTVQCIDRYLMMLGHAWSM